MPWIALIACSIFILLMALLSEVSDGGADAIVHHRMAKLAFKHHFLFFDLWGKPAFTILSSPFAYFGFTWHKIFNVIVAAITLFITWRTAKLFWLTPSWMGILFLCFSPVWLTLAFSTMTEPLIALIIVSGVYLYVKEKYILCAVLISLAPFARQEGYAYILLFLFAFILKKQYKAILFLASALVIISIPGYFVYDEIMWVFTQHPYGANLPTEGESFFHYFDRSFNMFGAIGAVCLGIGTVFSFFHRGNKKMEYLVLVSGGFWLLFLSHTFIYWLGIVPGNIGLVRVIACVAPLGAILMLGGLERILSWVRKSNWRLSLGVLIILLNTALNAGRSNLPLQKGPLELTHDKMGEWYKNTDHAGVKVWTSDPQLFFYCDVDVYDQNIWAEVHYHSPNSLTYMKPGDWLIWDGQFGGVHQKVPFDTLLKNPLLELIHIQVADHPMHSGNEFFHQYVFKRVSDSIPAKDNYDVQKAILGYSSDSMRIITLKGNNGKYVCVDMEKGGIVVCDRKEAREWEQLIVRKVKDTLVSLLGVSKRVLMPVKDASGEKIEGTLFGTMSQSQVWIKEVSDGKVELITPEGLYWCIDPKTEHLILCNHSSAYSMFTMEERK